MYGARGPAYRRIWCLGIFYPYDGAFGREYIDYRTTSCFQVQNLNCNFVARIAVVSIPTIASEYMISSYPIHLFTHEMENELQCTMEWEANNCPRSRRARATGIPSSGCWPRTFTYDCVVEHFVSCISAVGDTHFSPKASNHPC